MAVVSLKCQPDCRNFWQQRIQLNLTYWQSYLVQNSADTTVLEREWQAIVRAILLGLDLPAAWPAVFQLIVDFSNFMERRGYWDVWQSVLHRALPAATQADEITLSVLLARLHQRQGQVKPMIASCRRTIRLARQAGNRYDLARACSNLGYHFIEQGHWHRGEILCCYALEIFEALNSDHGRAHTENHLGILYFRRQLWERAEQHLNRACNIWEAMGDTSGLMFGYINLGALCYEAGRPKEGLRFLQQALALAGQMGDVVFAGRIYLNTGICYRIMGQFNQAEEYLRRADATFKRYPSLYWSGLVLDNLGLLATGRQQWAEAEKQLTLARQIWSDVGNTHHEIRVLSYLAQLELARDEPERANFWLRQAQQMLTQVGQTGIYWLLHQKIEKLHREYLAGIHGEVKKSLAGTDAC